MDTRRTFVNGSTPTVLLVHGAFADGSSWSGVIAELQTAGIAVTAPANPLRGVATDAAYLVGVVAEIDGPVLLVGHSYGGAVITWCFRWVFLAPPVWKVSAPAVVRWLALQVFLAPRDRR